MARVIFYEKPGCINNTKQKALLLNAGHQVEAHNLLKTSWTVAKLQAFFADLPINSWFNPSAPQIKSKEIIPEDLDTVAALELMIANPLLIRRPLIQVGGIYQVGFEQEKIDAWIGLKQSLSKENLENCPRIYENKSCS